MDRRNFIKKTTVGVSLAMLSNARQLIADESQILTRETSSIETEKTFSFCVVADPHCSEPFQPKEPRYTGLGQKGNGADKLLNCVREMEKLRNEDKPDFFLIVGDIHPETLKPILDDIKIPIHAIAGNHEDSARKKMLREFFPDDFKKGNIESDYYSFVHKGVRFIGVCDARPMDHTGFLCSEEIRPIKQCEWLENELVQKEKHKVVFTHIPSEPDGEDRFGFLSRNDSRYLNKLMKKAQPTAMFSGHQHCETWQFDIGRTQMITLRSCCWNGDHKPLGFMVVRMLPDGIVKREIFTGFYKQ